MKALLLLSVLWFAPQQGTGVLAGRITSLQGDPIAGIRVAALETAYPRMNIVDQAETDRDGRYRLQNVPAGEYFIVADPFSSPGYFPGTGNRDESRRVTVAAGATNSNLDFAFVRNSGILRAVRTPSPGSVKFSGVFRDTKGAGLPNITVSLTNIATHSRLWTVTNATGTFEFPALTSGEFSMENFSPDQKDFEELKVPIILHSDESLEEDFGLRPLGNNQQRPDLYAAGDLRRRLERAQSSGGIDSQFWRCQKANAQPQPQYPQSARNANIKGSVTVQTSFDNNGSLIWIRAVSADANPDLARATVEAVSRWNFTPLKWAPDSRNGNRLNPNCSGDGEVFAYQGSTTFNFPPD